MCGGFFIMKNIDEHFMKIALKEAEKAREIDEVPIGAVIVKDNRVIARGHNLRESKKDPLGHAELVAIKRASKKIGDWQLVDCTLYVTLEPCIMCGGAIIQSRIKTVVYGADDPKGGAFGSSINVLDANNINHKPQIKRCILKEECSQIIKNYFKSKRK